MANKVTGLGDNFYIGGYDISGDVSSLDTIGMPQGVLDLTGLTQKAYQRGKGLRDGDMSFTTFMDVNSPAVATPGVPGSGTPVVSTFNYTVRVTITGGTMSNVVVNGVSVGTGAGTYVVPAFGSITLTYTVAPTWNWFSLGTSHTVLSQYTQNSNDIIGSYFQGVTFSGNSIGQPAASMVSKQISYDPTRDSSGNLSLKIALQANAFGLEWGVQLTSGLRTDNGVLVGPFIDLGTPSSTAFGWQAYLHLIELVGTNVDVTITHSTTSGGTYTALADFGSQTAIGAFRVQSANTVTVNEFVKVTTAGTFSQAVFAVNFIRNPVAGVVFLCECRISITITSGSRPGRKATRATQCGLRSDRTGARPTVRNTSAMHSSTDS
jgi:hypothetical protein